jgi:transcriptional regulator of acetoin/glycerol metabolism
MAPLLRKMLAASESDENLPERLEKELITIALQESSGNVSHAARLIGMDRMALQRRIEKFGLL